MKLLPWVLDGLDLGAEVLELGPGRGVTADILRLRCEQLTCIEIDAELARSLAARLHGTNVKIERADARKMPFPHDHFSGVACFTMLHHVPSRAAQDQVLGEAFRVLKPGGWFSGCDSRTSLPFRILHLGDTMVMSDPSEFEHRLQRAGFREISIRLSESVLRVSRKEGVMETLLTCSTRRLPASGYQRGHRRRSVPVLRQARD